jgi:RNA polymerase sigma-70 factor (ECF subfamily)
MADSSPETGRAAVPSFEELYTAHFAEVARWARAMGGPSADLEDLCQEVFLTVRRRLPDFDGQNPSGWLYRITQRAVRSHRRKAWLRRALFVEDGTLERFEAGAEQPESAALAAERRRELSRALDRLGEKKRTALVLHEVEGLSGEEIATLEGVPVGTIYTRLFAARRELAAALARRRP